MEAVTDFIFLDSKITAGSNCTHEIKSSLFLERKALTNLDSILKGRDMTLLTKARMVKAKGFPVIMCGCDSWIKEKKKKKKRLNAKELMLLNCGPGEDSWESLGMQGYQTSGS